MPHLVSFGIEGHWCPEPEIRIRGRRKGLRTSESGHLKLISLKWDQCERQTRCAPLRDLAMFNLAIDSKPRGCDVVALRVEDIAPHGYAGDRATVGQRKTGQPVRFEVTEQTW
jgi:integrase